ncbi:OBSCURIN-LIKE PROTEIN [Salix purpurea]|uniref:OBSCURIN-LIKE PROTEIN n=1 Tax=Salix purpurea TaxID=77065 RepID=A0A9Q0TTB0_SALPP|nr:OBSCURIN-LIKE PROTEIN [Salix purpurea]
MIAHPFMLLTPQAKLLVSVLSSTNLVIPRESYTLLLRIFYTRVRKSSRPSSILIDSAVVSLSHLLAIEFGSKKSPEFLSESVLLMGAFSFVPSVSESSKTVCYVGCWRMSTEWLVPLAGSSRCSYRRSCKYLLKRL